MMIEGWRLGVEMTTGILSSSQRYRGSSLSRYQNQNCSSAPVVFSSIFAKRAEILKQQPVKVAGNHLFIIVMRKMMMIMMKIMLIQRY